jgi:hypothetical protein
MAIQKAPIPHNTDELRARQMADVQRRMRRQERNPQIREGSDVLIHGANIGQGDDGSAAFNADVNASSITAGRPGHTVTATTDENYL